MVAEYIWRADMSFGENLKRLRRDRGWNQGELATRAGIKPSHIPTLEKENGDPKLSTIYKLMDALDCSADSLLLDSKKMGISPLLASSFERADKLPENEKKIVIDLIDKYCIANGMGKLFEESKNTMFGYAKITGGIDKVIP